jgi:hypothetical protein
MNGLGNDKAGPRLSFGACWRAVTSISVAILTCLLASLAATSSVAQARNAPTVSARQLLRAALRNAVARGSVHESESARLSGQTSASSDDLARHDGRQEITRSDGVRAHVLIVGGRGYFSGNQAALVKYFGLPVSEARAVGTRWVSVPASSSAFAVVASDATLQSALHLLVLTRPLKKTAPTTIDGESVIGLKGDASGFSSEAGGLGSVAGLVYVSRNTDPLPVRATYRTRTGGSATLEFGDWGEHLRLRPPANVVPLSALGSQLAPAEVSWYAFPASGSPLPERPFRLVKVDLYRAACRVNRFEERGRNPKYATG